MEETYCIRITSADEIEIIEIDADEKGIPTLDAMHEAVDGYVEFLNIGTKPAKTIGNSRLLMVGDEEAKLRNKPVNIMATFLYNAEFDKIYDAICGDVILLVERGEDVFGFEGIDAVRYRNGLYDLFQGLV